jgi:hypothetical protein
MESPKLQAPPASQRRGFYLKAARHATGEAEEDWGKEKMTMIEAAGRVLILKRTSATRSR